MSYLEDDKPAGRIYDRQLGRRLLAYLAPYKLPIAISVLGLVIVSALRLAGPWLTQIAIDDYIRVDNMEGLTGIAALYMLILLVQFAVGFGQTYLTNWTGQRIMYDLRTALFSRVQSLDTAYFDRHPVGRIITRITNDVDVLNELFTSGVVSIFGDIVSLAGIVVIMLWLDWKLALISFSVIPLLFAATLVFKAKVRGSYRRVRSALARINSFLQENITGMSVVQVFVQEGRMFAAFQDRNREHRDANLQSILYYAVYYPVVNLIGALSIALIVWYGGVRNLEETITLGVLVAFIQYSERFYKPISDLSEKFNILQSAMASSERIFGLLDTKTAIEPPASPDLLPEVSGRVELRNVWFEYTPGNPVLRNVSLHVQPGEKVAIVGATGAGKSTIINLLCRFYDVQEGQVLIDGVDVRQMSLDQLRQSLAIVLQDVFLFSGTAAENVRLWARPIPMERVVEAGRRVHADRFVQRLPDSWDSPVSERGSSLSVGERQLLAFARALAHDPRILILDEATSSVDTETEMLIQDALVELLTDRTALIVAHRLSTIQNCDRIIVMHKGQIEEEGTHLELLRLQGIYHKLYQLQFKERALTGDRR